MTGIETAVVLQQQQPSLQAQPSVLPQQPALNPTANMMGMMGMMPNLMSK